MLDLSNYENAAEEGAVLELKDPAGRPLLYDTGEMDEKGKPVMKPVTIRLAGAESPRWVRAADHLGNRIQDSKVKREIQDIRNDRAQLLAAITLGWDGIHVDGKDVPFTTKDVQKLYVRFRWIMEQVDSFVGRRENFLPASSAN